MFAFKHNCCLFLDLGCSKSTLPLFMCFLSNTKSACTGMFNKHFATLLFLTFYVFSFKHNCCMYCVVQQALAFLLFCILSNNCCLYLVVLQTFRSKTPNQVSLVIFSLETHLLASRCQLCSSHSTTCLCLFFPILCWTSHDANSTELEHNFG